MSEDYSLQSRISRHEVNLRVAQVVALRGTCLRAKVGAVATIDNRIVATGYNGSLAAQDHCTSETCSPFEHCPNSVHAEANLIAYAAKKGVALEGATIYVTHSPCQKCLELIIQSGIKEVVYLHPYRDTNWDLLNASGLTAAQMFLPPLTLPGNYPKNED